MYKCSIFILFLLNHLQSSYGFEDTDSEIWVALNFLEKIRNLWYEQGELLCFQQRVTVNKELIRNIDDILVCFVTKKNLDKICIVAVY